MELGIEMAADSAIHGAPCTSAGCWMCGSSNGLLSDAHVAGRAPVGSGNRTLLGLLLSVSTAALFSRRARHVLPAPSPGRPEKVSRTHLTRFFVWVYSTISRLPLELLGHLRELLVPGGETDSGNVDH